MESRPAAHRVSSGRGKRREPSLPRQRRHLHVACLVELCVVSAGRYLQMDKAA